MDPSQPSIHAAWLGSSPGMVDTGHIGENPHHPALRLVSDLIYLPFLLHLPRTHPTYFQHHPTSTAHHTQRQQRLHSLGPCNWRNGRLAPASSASPPSVVVSHHRRRLLIAGSLPISTTARPFISPLHPLRLSCDGAGWVWPNDFATGVPRDRSLPEDPVSM